jgi:Zn-dependent protease
LLIIIVGYYAAKFYISIVPIAHLFGLVFFSIISSIIILFSIFLHELAHTIVSRHYNLDITQIELNFLGGFTKLETDPTTPKSEKHIALVGLISNLFIGIIIIAFFYVFRLKILNYLLASFYFVGISNIAIGIFNLIPAYPLDGGRILRAHFWSKSKDFFNATYLAYKISVIIGSFFLSYGLYLIFILQLIQALFLLFIGILLISSAKYSYTNSRKKLFKKG